MKRIIQISVLLLLCTLAYGGNVTKEQALQKALQFTNSRPHVVNGKRLAPGKNFQLREAKGERKGFYAFNIGEQNGFVLVSADDRTPAILGYANKGTYNVDDMPENMRAWLQGYADQMDYLEKHPGANVLSTAQLDEHTPIAPMLTSTWNQLSPYNNMCPFDGGYRSVTGCVATAMAQVLYYHRYPAQTTATIPAYTTETNGISVDEIGITSIDWNNMLDNYTGSETTLQKKAVANLMKLCGASVEMDYGSSSSGASGFMAEPALKNYFGYDASTFMADRSNYRAKEWNDLVYDELANNRPVYYTGQSLGGGHAFVIDGYDKDGYFHVNWGWGGDCDSYFLLSILDPDSNDGIGASSSTDGYSFYQGALIDAQPYTGQPNSNAIMTIYTMTVENSVIAKQDDVFPISAVGEIYNMTNETINFELGLGIYTKDNELLYAESNGNEELESGWGWTSLELGANVPALPDGDYIITTISRNMGTTKWHQSLGSTKCYAIATIAGDQLTLKMPITDLSGSMEIVGDQKVGNQLTVKTTIDNNGTPFNDIFWLFVNGYEVGAQHFDIAGEASDVLEMSFTPNTKGNNNISLGYYTYEWDEWDEVWNSYYTEVASTIIDISSNAEICFSNGEVTNALGKIILSNTAQIKVNVTNNGANDYNDEIRTWLFKEYEDGDYYAVGAVDTPVFIAAGTAETVDIEAEGLSDGRYWFVMVYKNGDDFIDFTSDECYDDLFGYKVDTSEKYAVTEGFMPEDNQEIQATTSIKLKYGADGSWKTASSSTVFNNADIFTHFVVGSNNPKTSNNKNFIPGNVETLPVKGTYYSFTASQSGYLKVALKLFSGKEFFIADSEDGHNYSEDAVLTDVNGTVYTLVGNQLSSSMTGYAEIGIQKDQTLYMFCNGSKMQFFGFSFTPGEVIEDPGTPHKSQVWDFTASLSGTDKLNIAEDDNWSIVESGDGTATCYTYNGKLQNVPVMANGIELKLTTGLNFNCGEGKFEYHDGERLAHNGNGHGPIIKKCGKDDIIKIRFATSAADRGFEIGNAELTDGELICAEAGTHEATLTAKKKGNVTFSSIGGADILALAVNTELPETGTTYLQFSDGIVSNADENKVIYDDYINIDFNVTNISNTDYNDKIRTWFFKQNELGEYSSVGCLDMDISIAAGETSEVGFGTPLENGIYKFIMVYKKGEDFIDWDSEESYGELEGYIVQAPEMPEEPEVPENEMCYLRNVATKKFLGAGNNWGTRASLVDEYQYVILQKLEDGNYTLESMVSNGGSAYYFNGDFMDNANPVELTFTKQENGYYTIANGNNYYGYDGSTTILGKNLAADSENALWEILTEEDILNEKNAILSSATADNPVDATFLIQNSGFGRNRIDGAWAIYNSWNYNLGGPNASEGNYCAESYHSTFQLEQNIDVPKGVYKLTAQGFYRQDGTDNDDLPYFFAYCYETGESSNARFPYKTGSENSMADAANSFENGLYTSDPMYIEMPSDGMMAIGAYLAENVDLWCIWDNFHLTYYGPDADINALKNAGLIAGYEKALADATEALTDEEYTIVAGEERENLSAVIAEHENVGSDETSLQNALEALTEATETFKMAKASYKRLADVLSLIGQYPYASASKTAAIESYKTYAPTSADDATTKLQTWQPAIRRYVESNALLESIEGSIDMTNSIQNPNAEDGKNGWTTILATPGYINVLSGEPLTDADGYSGYSYFDGGNWSGTNWDVSLEQEIELPKGHYLLSVSSRASAGLSTFCLYAGDNRKEMLHIGATQGLFGNGWNDAFVEFELEDDAMINIGVQGKATPVQNWMSFTRFRLAKFPIPTETVTVTAAGYATYVSDNNLDYSEVQGLTAYKANVSGATISFEKVTTVPAGEGVLLKGEGVFEVPQVNNVAPWTDDYNAFIRGTGAAVETGSGPYNYILNNVGGIVGFYRANNQVVAKNRAYIQTTVNAARLSISFDDEESTDVHATVYQESSGNTTFNLNGQRVEKPQKGLYVKEGRKVIFK